MGKVVGKDGTNGKDGTDGTDGVGVSEAEINSDGELILYFSNSTNINLGKIVGKDGKDGTDGVGIETVTLGDTGDLSVKLTNGTTLNLGNVKGADGVGISDVTVTAEGELKMTLTDGTSLDLGNIRGPQGEKGDVGAVGPQGPQGVAGSVGATGAQGVGVSNAYINEEVHLILILTDGTEVDAGYVGIEIEPQIPVTYTVTFLDYDGSVIKKQTGIRSGGSAIPPADPVRKGYEFTGWSGNYNNVTEDMELTAQYRIARNQLYFTYKDNADGTMTATMTICGDVNFYGLEMSLQINSLVGLQYQELSAPASGASAYYNGESIKLSYVNTTGIDNNAETDLLTVCFQVTGSVQNLEFEISDVDIFDESYGNETYGIANNTYSKG